MERYERNVLVVEPDPAERERLAGGLEAEGFEVLLCSGPVAPDYTCIGGREGRCPLAPEGCVVVLDTDLDSDAAVAGTSSEELLGFYLAADHRVVTLSSRPLGSEDERLLQLRRHPEMGVLLAAVRWSASPSPSARPLGHDAWS